MTSVRMLYAPLVLMDALIGCDFFGEILDFKLLISSPELLSADLIRSAFWGSMILMSELTVFTGSRTCGGLNIGVRVYEVTSSAVSGFEAKMSEFGR